MDSSEPAPRPNRSKTIGFVIAGAIALIVIGALAVVLLPGTNSTSQQQPAQFQNWLKPTSEIKVGDSRYISPCSALPLQTVNELFGPLGDKSVIQETYADQSFPTNTTLPVSVKCSYNPVTGAGPGVVLEAEQYTDPSKASLRASTSVAEDRSQVEIDRYKKAIADTKTTDKAVTGLVANFQSSLDYYNAHPSYRNEGPLPKNYIIPISKSVSGLLNDFSYTWQYQNNVFVFGHSPNTLKSGSDYQDYSSQQLVAELGKISKVYAAMLANVQNEQLDQSPAPTIIGNADKYGSTTILDSCAILTPSVFAKISGKSQNREVDRTSAAVDITTKKTTKDGHLILPSNDCGRQAETPVTELESDSTYADLTMRYGSSAQQAKEWLNNNFKVEADDTVLSTNADWAASFVNPVDPSKAPIVVFRVGAYIGIVSMYTSPADGDDIEASGDQYVTAINELTTSIKQNIANIQQ